MRGRRRRRLWRSCGGRAGFEFADSLDDVVGDFEDFFGGDGLFAEVEAEADFYRLKVGGGFSRAEELEGFAGMAVGCSEEDECRQDALGGEVDRVQFRCPLQWLKSLIELALPEEH